MKVAKKIFERDDLLAIKIRTLEGGETVWRCEYTKERVPFYSICLGGYELYVSKPGSANHTRGLAEAIGAYQKINKERQNERALDEDRHERGEESLLESPGEG